MKGRSPTFTQLPLDIVGSTKFGRYPKVSVEQTFNMIISDGFLVPYAGHKIVTPISDNLQGRAIYTSIIYNHMVVVVGNTVYTIDENLTSSFISGISTFTGDVFIDENNNNQIAICDLSNIYIFNYVTGVFTTLTAAALGFIPGYISYQNGRFVAAAFDSAANKYYWRLSAVGDGTSWPNDAQHIGPTMQTKPDRLVATQRFPGRGNTLSVMGATVSELWTDIGAALFPYQRNQTVNIDYGCVNPATIAFNDNIIVWVAANEKSGPMIAYSTGGDINKISTDGIDFKLSQLTAPQDSYGFLFRQDGHLLYQFTFTTDNFSYVYDFNTKMFFSLLNQDNNAHIAKRVTFFNNDYFFVSTVDGNVYEMGTQFTTYNGKEIPRVRVCKNIRMPDASRFSVNNLTFTLEQGTQDNVILSEELLTENGHAILTQDSVPIDVDFTIEVPIEAPLLTEALTQLLTEDDEVIDAITLVGEPYIVPQKVALSVSKNGGQSFGTIWSKQLNAKGLYRNRLIYWNLGAANDFVPQFRFWGLGRFVVTDGIASIYQ